MIKENMTKKENNNECTVLVGNSETLRPQPNKKSTILLYKKLKTKDNTQHFILDKCEFDYNYQVWKRVHSMNGISVEHLDLSCIGLVEGDYVVLEEIHLRKLRYDVMSVINRNYSRGYSYLLKDRLDVIKKYLFCLNDLVDTVVDENCIILYFEQETSKQEKLT